MSNAIRWSVDLRVLPDEDALREITDDLGGKLLGAGSESFALFLPSFDSCNTAAEVWSAAKTFRDALREFEALEPTLRLSIELGDVWEHNDDGSRNRCIFLEAKMGSVKVSGSGTTGVRGRRVGPEEAALLREAEEQARRERRNALIKLAIAAAANERIVMVMKLLREPQLNPTQLGNIVELIQASGANLQAFTSRRAFKRFERSINHQSVLGLEARHAASTDKPPPEPMGLAEAREFARGLARKWLDTL